MRKKTITRMHDRVCELIAGFPDYVAVFTEAKLFTGPSMHFHLRTLEQLRMCGSPAVALEDYSFVELLYATLTAWGMHRMGKGGAKLAEFGIFRDSLRRQSACIRELAGLDIRTVSDAANVAARLWKVISALRVSIAKTKIVAGSKALHHVLPDLIPPIDREYTIRFFLESTTMSQGDEPAFHVVYPMFVHIAVACGDKLDRLLGTGMNTSVTKVIDNAIVGYVLRHFKGWA